MDNNQILEAVERYIAGQMNPDERVYFEQLRKSNPEIDQLVVEHTFFLQQFSRFDETRKLKSILNETHIHLAEKGQIESPRLKGKARVVYLYNRYKRTAAIAASIAGITALTMSALIWQLSSHVKPAQEVQELRRDIKQLETKSNQLENKSNQLEKKVNIINDQTKVVKPLPAIEYKSGGTGFLVDTKGYVVTNAHVIEGARHVAIQGSNNTDMSAQIVYVDQARDIAILKITDKSFKSPASIPYAIRRSTADIAEPIYTLGYPRNDIVYGEGYLSARTGFNGDTLSCQITVAANRGNSGSPILNSKGEVIGILSAKQNTAEGAVFAIHSKYILNALTELQKDSSYKSIKIPASSSLKGSDRTQQVKKISDYVYMVKVD